MRALILSILLLSSVSFAGDFSLTLENDLFSGVDRHYTHGTRFSYLYEDAPEWFNKCFTNRYNRMGISLSQHMYTPSNISIKELIPNDRPYGGWLYIGTAFLSRKGDWLDFINVDIGVTGPYSFSGDTQTCIHRLLNNRLPQGWEHQIKTEPGLDITYEKKYRWRYNGLVDVIPYAGGCDGNIFTYADIGCMARFGYNIPDDFGYARMEPAPREIRWFSCYIFGNVEGRYVLRNIFLDGNTWVDSHSVDKEDFVTDLTYGVGIGLGKFELLFGNTYRTREFVLQEENNRFSTLILTWKF